jgi:hypothetical protein
MKVSDLTAALSKMPQDANIFGIFVQRQGELSPEREQEYKVRIVSQDNNKTRYTAQFEYRAYIPENSNAPLKQKPFAGIKNLFT